MLSLTGAGSERCAAAPCCLIKARADLDVMLSLTGAGSERCAAASLATRLGFAPAVA
jgi:hypothetical protein